MEYKYLKLPIITVEHFYENLIYPKAEQDGAYIITDGVAIQLWYICTPSNPSDKKSWKMPIESSNVHDCLSLSNPTSQVGSDTTIVPKGGYVSEESLIEIIKQITICKN